VGQAADLTGTLRFSRGVHEKIISTERAPKAIGPYSQAVISNGWAFLSGQIPLDPATNQIVEGGIGVQTERVDRESEERAGSRRVVTSIGWSRPPFT
jgi:hypothetical protein